MTKYIYIIYIFNGTHYINTYIFTCHNSIEYTEYKTYVYRKYVWFKYVLWIMMNMAAAMGKRKKHHVMLWPWRDLNFYYQHSKHIKWSDQFWQNCHHQGINKLRILFYILTTYITLGNLGIKEIDSFILIYYFYIVYYDFLYLITHIITKKNRLKTIKYLDYDQNIMNVT